MHVTVACHEAASDLKANVWLLLYWLMFTIGYCLSIFVDKVLILVRVVPLSLCSHFSTFTHASAHSWLFLNNDAVLNV